MHGHSPVCLRNRARYPSPVSSQQADIVLCNRGLCGIVFYFVLPFPPLPNQLKRETHPALPNFVRSVVVLFVYFQLLTVNASGQLAANDRYAHGNQHPLSVRAAHVPGQSARTINRRRDYHASGVFPPPLFQSTGVNPPGIRSGVPAILLFRWRHTIFCGCRP